MQSDDDWMRSHDDVDLCGDCAKLRMTCGFEDEANSFRWLTFRATGYVWCVRLRLVPLKLRRKKNTNKIWIQTVFVMRCRSQICMIGTISVKPNNKHKTTKNRYLRKRLPAAFCAESRWKTCPINPKRFHSVCCVIFNRSFFHANRICFSPILCERGRSVCSVRFFAHKLAIKEYFFTKSLSPQSNGAAKRSQCAVNVCDCGFA